MNTKRTSIAMVVSLAAIVSFADSIRQNMSGMEYWGEALEEIRQSTRNGTGEAEVLRRLSRSFVTSTEGLEWLKQNK